MVQGLNIIVTGATDGIGKVTARELAKEGARVLIVGRHAEKTAAVVSEINATLTQGHIEGLVADLSLPSEVQRLAAEIRGRFTHIDVLINNAGAYFKDRSINSEGLEQTFALNHLSYFLLTKLLLQQLKKAPAARIVNVSSMAHEGASLDFSNLEGEKSYGGWAAYAQSKLMNVLFTVELARRLKGTRITVNSLHPGFVASRFGHSNPGVLAAVFKFGQRLFGISVEEGAATSIFLAASPKVAGVSGRYFVKCKEQRAALAAANRADAKRLWEESERRLAAGGFSAQGAAAAEWSLDETALSFA
jgi:NAD(P)-dependent dehydrogenase (short-subunit alcohol dehydrogenase family)